ncbi:MAG: sugar ABC transporter permease [Clostridia bacterium]|nr:sugar ABC transporter permease [Clostridia bacterium]
MATQIKKGGATLAKKKRNQLLFYIALVALPSIQFVFFYIYVNFNSIMLAFQRWNVDKAAYEFNGFASFKEAFMFGSTDSVIASKILGDMIENSLILYAFTLLVGIPLAIIFSYYIYKKCFLSGAFKVFLFMPSIVSGLVLSTIYMYFCDAGIPELFGLEQGLFSNQDTKFGTILFYTIFMGFGTQVLMYVGTMSGISESLIEAGQLDGIKPWQELLFIVVPLVLPTIITFIVVGVAGMFTNQMSLYNFYGNNSGGNLSSKHYTFGYYLFAKAKSATWAEYPSLSALGITLTLVCAPLTLGIRWLLNKFGKKFA